MGANFLIIYEQIY